MPISSSYRKDVNIQDEDLILGVKYSNNITVNYPAQSVADYLNINSKISIGGQISFKFTITPYVPKTIAFNGGLGNNTPFANITQLVVSSIDLTSNNVTVFLNYLVNSDILLMQQNFTDNFGHYKITGYSQIGTSDFYTLSLDFIGGNGSILDNTYYDISSLVLGGGSSSTPNLQQVTDVGYFTTNRIDSTNQITSQTFQDSGFGTALDPAGIILVTNNISNAGGAWIKSDFSVSNDYFQLPDKGGLGGTFAMLSDLPTSFSLQTVVETGNTVTGTGGTISIDSQGGYIDLLSATTNKDIQIGDATILLIDPTNSGFTSIDTNSIGISNNLSSFVLSATSDPYIAIQYLTIKQTNLTANRTVQFQDASGTVAYLSNIPTVGTWGALNYPTWTSGTPFVKMTAAGVFALDYTSYYPSSNPAGFITTSSLTGYVPYTGATSDVDLDIYGLNAKFLSLKGTAGYGHLGMKHQSSNATAGGGETVVWAGSDGEPRYKNDGNAVQLFASQSWVTSNYVTLTTDQTIAGVKTFSNATILSSLNASQILALDSFKNIQSLSTSTYPSLTELSYVKGVTSAIQTQFNNLPAFSQSGLTIYAGTITWSGTTAPSGTTNFSYNWTKIGNQVTLNITLLYGTAGTLNTSVVMTLPTGSPTPVKPTGLTNASEKLYQGSGKITQNTTGLLSNANECVLRSNSTNNGFEIVLTQTGINARLVNATIVYFTA